MNVLTDEKDKFVMCYMSVDATISNYNWFSFMFSYVYFTILDIFNVIADM